MEIKTLFTGLSSLLFPKWATRSTPFSLLSLSLSLSLWSSRLKSGFWGIFLRVGGCDFFQQLKLSSYSISSCPLSLSLSPQIFSLYTCSLWIPPLPIFSFILAKVHERGPSVRSCRLGGSLLLLAFCVAKLPWFVSILISFGFNFCCVYLDLIKKNHWLKRVGFVLLILNGFLIHFGSRFFNMERILFWKRFYRIFGYGKKWYLQ